MRIAILISMHGSCMGECDGIKPALGCWGGGGEGHTRAQLRNLEDHRGVGDRTARLRDGWRPQHRVHPAERVRYIILGAAVSADRRKL
jgi:hypothetical protein